ncbi:MAG: hypothetical protein IPK72_23100 [Candidatus Eisenbacteria bacterium]|nr:hypothetical protein [Candidatus Eisenbacteria bacterium]
MTVALQSWSSSITFVCLVSLCVAYVWYRIREKDRRPTQKEWHMLYGQASSLRHDMIATIALSKPTRRALAMVLTNQRGVGRRSDIPRALEILEDAAHELVHTTRSVGGLMILAGLFSTVLQFANVFGGVSAGTLDAQSLGTVGGTLMHVYIYNAFAVGMALICLCLGAYYATDGARILDLAFDTLDHLQDHVIDIADPKVVAAIEILQERQSTQTKDLMESQLTRVESLVGEVRRLADAMKSVVEELGQQAATRPEEMLAPIRAVQASMESLQEGLDLGIKALAEPFAGGVPAMRKLSAAAEKLDATATRLGATDPVVAIGEIGKTAAELAHCIRQLPEQVSDALIRVTNAAPKAVESGARRGIGDLIEKLSDKMSHPLREGHADLDRSVKELAEEFGKLREALALDRSEASDRVARGVAAALDESLRRIDANLGGIPVAVEKLSDSVVSLEARMQQSGKSWWR